MRAILWYAAAVVFMFGGALMALCLIAAVQIWSRRRRVRYRGR